VDESPEQERTSGQIPRGTVEHAEYRIGVRARERQDRPRESGDL